MKDTGMEAFLCNIKDAPIDGWVEIKAERISLAVLKFLDLLDIEIWPNPEIVYVLLGGQNPGVDIPIQFFIPYWLLVEIFTARNYGHKPAPCEDDLVKEGKG
jgi:hypothetical protein